MCRLGHLISRYSAGSLPALPTICLTSETRVHFTPFLSNTDHDPRSHMDSPLEHELITKSSI